MLEPNDTPGRRLRALRESRKLDVERVAAQLHLQRHVVEAIEGDQYERLPAPVFVVGYLKNYARLLGADPAPIVTAYRAMVPAREVGLSHALSVSDDSSHPSGGGSRWVWVIAVLLIGVAAGMATLWLRGQSDSTLQSDALALSPKGEESASTIAAPSDTSNATATASPAGPESTIAAPPESIPLRGTQSQSPTGTTPTEPAAPTAQPQAPVETLVAASTLTGAQNTTEEAPEDGEEASDAETQAESVTETPTPEPTSTEVVLEFTGTSWVDVRGANGRVVLNGEMRSGDRRVLDGEPPYKFVIGNTAATQLTVGGRPFDLKRRAQGNVARFSLDPSSFE
ncbi:MAG: helix-turn-helix domain-containing protein [Chromatiales bacterium]|nr:helix-turn-helix domain-containing protein [Chromatiales bacterium]